MATALLYQRRRLGWRLSNSPPHRPSLPCPSSSHPSRNPCPNPTVFRGFPPPQTTPSKNPQPNAPRSPATESWSAPPPPASAAPLLPEPRTRCLSRAHGGVENSLAPDVEYLHNPLAPASGWVGRHPQHPAITICNASRVRGVATGRPRADLRLRGPESGVLLCGWWEERRRDYGFKIPQGWRDEDAAPLQCSGATTFQCVGCVSYAADGCGGCD